MIYVQRENIEGAILKLKYSLIREGLNRSLERHKFARSPSQKKRWKCYLAEVRRRKLQRIRQERFEQRGRELRKLRAQKVR